MTGANDRGTYDRNVFIVLSAVSALVFAGAIGLLRSSQNPLRAGLLLGGTALFSIAIGFWAGASNDWVGLPLVALNFGALLVLHPYLESGMPRHHPETLPPGPPPPAAMA